MAILTDAAEEHGEVHDSDGPPPTLVVSILGVVAAHKGDRTRQEKTRGQDMTRHDKGIGQDKTRGMDRTRQDKTRHGTGQDKGIGQDKTGQGDRTDVVRLLTGWCTNTMHGSRFTNVRAVASLPGYWSNNSAEVFGLWLNSRAHLLASSRSSGVSSSESMSRDIFREKTQKNDDVAHFADVKLSCYFAIEQRDNSATPTKS